MAHGASMRWVGPGATAFALPGGASSPSVPRHCESRDAFTLAFGGEADRGRSGVVQSYFAASGRGCFVLFDARFGDKAWIGEDAGPGARTGIHALAEEDGAGTIFLAGASSVRREEQVVDLAARRPEILFVIEGEGGRGVSLSFLRPNVAVLAALPVPAVPAAPARREKVGGDASSAGDLAAYLEASDWSEEVAFRRERPQPPQGLTRSDCEPLHAWRRREGLRRSIDLGTRWVLFELSHPPLWRSVERETKAFLYRLERGGFFQRCAADRLDAWCSRCSESESESDEREAGEAVRARGGGEKGGIECLTVRVMTGAPARGACDPGGS